jgi:SNF2 family DNA or RNA helicase
MVKRYNAGGCYGSFSRSEQDEAIKEFQAGRLKVLTANTRSAGYGLNLQVCNQIIFGDVPITPRDFLQAESRCWRQGQKERVVITVLVAKGTIQTKLFSTIMEKDDQMTAVTQSKESLRKVLLGA